jgi:asparagine synthase (glutamine-hydrolysing)
MSGIAGIIHFDGKPVEPGLIEKMTSAMAHRGPDGINHWVKGSVALGQCMQRTTPESLEEHQPLTNEDGSLVLVMDGRVDNWEELRRELLGRGAVLRDRSDAELEPVYEQYFLPFFCGFRPRRGAHQALDALLGRACRAKVFG